MSLQNPHQTEDRIARCRLILSVVALAAVFADPTEPLASSWFSLVSGGFSIDPYVLGVMGTHLVYSTLVYLGARRGWLSIRHLTTTTLWTDVVLGAAIAFMTEGAASPFYAFFAFAVIVAGFRSGLRQTMQVTAVSVTLYVGLIVISTSGDLNFYIMRPAYLSIVGYLVGYLGQQRIDMQQEIHQLEAAEQRHRIARDLHDGFAQALAGINLRIEGCRRLLRRSAGEEALAELTDLQRSVNREYDELRSYMQTLAGVRPSPAPSGALSSTNFSVRISVDGPIDLIDHILQIAREGVSNVRRHAAAATARIQISTEESRIQISIEDDGVGLQDQSAPWSIASRVKELGGHIEIAGDGHPGARMSILLPEGLHS